MLGRLRRTTRLDVGLALGFVGGAYLVWALVAGVTRSLVARSIPLWDEAGLTLDLPTRVVRTLFLDAAFAIDLAGLSWLVGSLLLVVLASRQRMRISWAWVSAMLQSFAAALGGIWVAWAVHLPETRLVASGGGEAPTALAELRELSLPATVTLAVLIWVVFLVWLLVERARLSRHGPTLSDSLRTHSYK